ncbi:MAG: AMP-binding protein [Alphaproteobacteria bacterium]
MSGGSGAERTVARVLAGNVERHGDKPFLIAEGGAISYGEMEARSNRLAHGLAALGIGAGDTVLAMLPNHADFVTLWLALAKLGAVQVPVNTAYRGAILAHVINDSRARTMIVGAQFLERLAAVAGELRHLQRCVVHAQEGAVAALPEALAGRCRALAFAELLAHPEAPLEVLPRESDLVAVMYTSGTTGPSKGVMIPHAQAYEYASGAAQAVELGPDDVYYAPLPLFHLAGQWAVVYAACIEGATAVLTGGFHVGEFWADVARHRVTATFLLGAMANFLYRQAPSEGEARTTLAKVLMAPLIPELDGFKRRFGVAVGTAYGSTELGTVAFHGFRLPNARSCGRPRDDTFELRVVDADDQALAPGEVGEIVVRARQPWTLMSGYWQRPEATAEAWRNLWLHSGDAGTLDAAGNLYFVDRLKDAIRRRGENISSIEVENEINAHPAVAESAAFPVASEHGEQEVMAALVLEPGAALRPEALIRFLAPRMAYFMVPRYLDFVAALPKTATGKVQKYALRERGLGAGAWDREAAGIKLER